jgi:hypothetical protein
MNYNWIGIDKTKKEHPLGKSTPWGWMLEPHYGCNLKCGHCCAELISHDKYQAVDKKTWENLFKIINEVSPTSRLDLAGMVGEPTLHPEIYDILRIARKISPKVQIQVTTNGTNLINGKVNYKALLEAGANIVYTDQYGSHAVYEKLAEESGYPYYQYYDAPKDAPSPWTYHGPDLKVIVLMEEPSTWPQSRVRANVLGNWFGHLNWEKAKKFGMKPLEEPMTRRCNMPFYYVPVTANGDYLLCCQDGMHTTAGKFGNVNEGIEGFKKFWFGKEMQIVRYNLRNKNRAGIKNACDICNATFSRCDYIHWKHDTLDTYIDGDTIVNISPDELKEITI